MCAASSETVSVGAGPRPGAAARGAGVSQGPESGAARKQLVPGSELWGQMQVEVLASIPGPPGCPLCSLGLTAGPGAEQWWESDTLHMWGGGAGENGWQRKDGGE